jgi:hypothetical protein
MEFTEEKLTDSLNQYQIPQNMHNGILNWIIEGTIPGNFLYAVVNNDLRGSLIAADDINITRLTAYIQFFYNAAPGGCWGSKEKTTAWHIQGGLRHVNFKSEIIAYDGLDNEEGE